MALRSLTDARSETLAPEEQPHPVDLSMYGPGESWSPEDDLNRPAPMTSPLEPLRGETVIPAPTQFQKMVQEEKRKYYGSDQPQEVSSQPIPQDASPGTIEPSSMQRYAEAMQIYLGIGQEELKKEDEKVLKDMPLAITWEDIWAHVLKAEGGYANNPLDPGGETKFGISKAAYPGLNISALTVDDASAIFKTDYFDKVGGDILLKINPGVAAHVADMAFNAGPQTAINLLYDSVGLPRKNSLTNELLERINADEKAIEDYSKARLAYYSGLYNAPTFIRGWINRVSELNKVLGTKSGLGGAYAAARDLDVEYLVQNQYGSYRNAQPRFRDLDASERGYLSDRERVLGPGYETAKGTQPANISEAEPSSIKDIFYATQSNLANVQSNFGLDSLVLKEVEEAYRLNMEALGQKPPSSDPFAPGDDAFKTKMLSGIITRLIKDNPDVDFPVKSMEQVYAAALEKSQAIENKYAQLENAPLNSLGGVVNRIGQVLFGYLPGQIVGMAQDPYELALMAATGGQARTASQVGKLAAMTFLGEGAIQVGVQSKRSALGLDGSFKQGLENAASAGIGVAAIGGVSIGLQKLWKLGSKDAAKVADSLANQIDSIVDNSAKTPDSLYLKREVGGLKDMSYIYKNNPLGHNYQAKIIYEDRMSKAVEDLATGKPVRTITDDIRKYVKTDKNFVKDMHQAIKDSGPDGELMGKAYLNQVESWDKYKKSFISRNVYQSLDDVDNSVIPVVNAKTNEIHSFSTLNDAKKYLNSKEAEGLIEEYAVDIAKFPDKPGYFLVRTADIEPTSALSGRMLEGDTIEDSVGGVLARGFKESDDLATAAKYPNYSRVKEFKPTQIADDLPSYPKNYAQEESREYVKQLDDYFKTSKITAPKESEMRLIARLEEMDQAHIKAGNKGPAMMDISDTLGVEERVSVRDFINELQEERAGLAGMLDCMV